MLNFEEKMNPDYLAETNLYSVHVYPPLHHGENHSKFELSIQSKHPERRSHVHGEDGHIITTKFEDRSVYVDIGGFETIEHAQLLANKLLELFETELK